MCLVYSEFVLGTSKPSMLPLIIILEAQGMRLKMGSQLVVVKGMIELRCQWLRSRAVFRIFSCYLALSPSWVFPLIFFFFSKLIPSLCFLFLSSEWQVRRISRLKEVSLRKMRLTPFCFFLKAGPMQKANPGLSCFIFKNQIARIKRHRNVYPTHAISVLEVELI